MKSDTSKIKKAPVAVICGGMGYLGSEISKRLAKEGMRVAVLDREIGAHKKEDFSANLFGSGHGAYACDITDASAVAEIISKIENEMGKIFACVLAVGTMPPRQPLHLTSEKEIRDQFEVNVFGAFNFLSACAARLKNHGAGVMVGITTAAVISEVNTKTRGAYSPVKFALQGMLHAFREELSPSGVRVYSVAPGVMEGGLNKDTPKAFMEILKEKSPTKALTDAKSVAGVISFLCSDSAKDITNLTVLVAPESLAC